MLEEYMYVISRKPYVLPNRVGLYFQSWPLVFGSSIDAYAWFWNSVGCCGLENRETQHWSINNLLLVPDLWANLIIISMIFTTSQLLHKYVLFVVAFFSLRQRGCPYLWNLSYRCLESRLQQFEQSHNRQQSVI